jgi:hypothetical protein
MVDKMTYGRFLITFVLYPKAWFFGISFAEYDEIDAYTIGFGLGAGSIILGIKR